jgi:hypothetical protein
MNILVSGKVFAIKTQTNKDSGEVTLRAQFLKQDKDNGGAEIVDVKLTHDESINVNDIVKIPVKISTFNSNIFYTQTDKMLK